MSDEIIEAGRNDCIKAYCVKSSFATRSKWLSQHPQVMQLPASITDTKIPKHIRFCLYMAHQGFAKILDSNFIEGLPVKNNTSNNNNNNNNSKTVSTAAGGGEQDATSTSTGSVIIPPEKRTVSACIGTFLRECASKMKGASMSILTRNHHKLFAVLCGISKNPFDSEQTTSDSNNNDIDDAQNKENNNQNKNEDASGGDNVNDDNDENNQASSPSSPELTIQQEFELAYKKFKAPNALVFDTFYDDHNPMKTREEKRIEMEKRLEQEALAELKLMEEKARQQQERQEKLRQQKEEDEKKRKAEKEQRMLMKQQRREERMKLAQQQQQHATNKEAPNRRKRQEDDNDDEGYQQNQQLVSDGGNQLLQHEQIQLGVYYDEDDDENTEDENSNLVFEELAKRQQQQNGNANNNNSLNIVDNANHFQISRGQNSTINNPFSYTGNNNQQNTSKTAAAPEGVFSVQKLRKKILAIINSQQLVTIRDLPQLLNKTDTSEIGSGWTIADIEDCVNDLQKIGSVFVEEGTIFV